MAPLLAPLGFAHGRVSSFLPALLCLPRAECPGPSARCSSPWPALGPTSAPKLPLLATPAWPEFLPPPARRRTDCGLLLQLRRALCPSLLFLKFGRVELPSVHGCRSSSSQPRPLLPASPSLLLCEPLPVPSRFLLAWPERPALCSPSQAAVFPARLACSSSCAVRRQAPACAVLCRSSLLAFCALLAASPCSSRPTHFSVQPWPRAGALPLPRPASCAPTTARSPSHGEFAVSPMPRSPWYSSSSSRCLPSTSLNRPLPDAGDGRRGAPLRTPSTLALRKYQALNSHRFVATWVCATRPTSSSLCLGSMFSLSTKSSRPC
jgi:hypothetical protein